MKIKNEFVLRQILGENVIFYVGQTSDASHQIFSINESGVLLWKALEEGADECALTAILCKEYDVSEEIAAKDVALFLQILREKNCLEEA